MLSDRIKARNSRRRSEEAAAAESTNGEAAAASAVSVPKAPSDRQEKMRARGSTTERAADSKGAVQDSMLRKAESYDPDDKKDPSNSLIDEGSSSGFTLVAAVNVPVGERDVEANNGDENDSPALTAMVVDEAKERDRYFRESLSQGHVVTASVIDLTNRRLCFGLLVVVAISSLIAGVSLAGQPGSDAKNTNTVQKLAWVTFANNISLCNETFAYPPETDTPEQQALQWLVEEHNLAVPLLDAKQWFALAVMSFAMNAPVLRSNPTVSSCEHLAITCDTTSNEIISIDLHQVDLNGTIPNDVALLTKLTSLDLGYNALSGTVPWDLLTSRLTELVFLDIDVNKLTGTLPSPTNGTWPKMEMFWVMKNTFTGTISTGYSYMTSLQHFYARDNELEGTLPTEFGVLDQLTWFNVEQNQLTGTIPSEYGMWSNLIYFEADRNKLHSTLPAEIVQWTNLQEFWINSNDFEGSLPDGIGNWTNLELMYLHANELTGTLPEDVGAWTALKTFRIDANKFSGTLPTEIGLWTDLGYIYINSNDFSGTIPAEVSNWTEIDEAHFHSTDLLGAMPLCHESIYLNTLFASCCKVRCPCCSTCLYGVEGANDDNCTILEQDLS